MSAPIRWPNGHGYPGNVWWEYGPRRPIWTPEGPTSNFHGGIDIGPWGDKGGTWMLAPTDGVVASAGYDLIYGNRVVIRATVGGRRVDFWLCHGRNGSIQVRPGQHVSQGQRLLAMGETGKALGVHLHYEIHVNGVRVNPRTFHDTNKTADTGARPFTHNQEDEMTASYINVQGKEASHEAGTFAIMRDNAGELFAKRVTRGTLQPDAPTIPPGELPAWRQTMPFHGL